MDRNVVLKSAALSAAQRRLEKILRDAQMRREADKSHLVSECTTCATILQVLNAPTSLRAEAPVGKWEDIVRSTCKNHSALFPPNDRLVGQEIFLRRSVRQNLLYIYPNPYSTGQQRAALEAPWEWFEPDEQASLFSETPWQSRPRIVDSSWINPDLPKSWLSECKMKHKGVCDNDQEQDNIDILLVDVSNRCLVQADWNSPYVALSYVWGRANRFLTLTDNLEQLLRPGSLDKAGLGGTLPRTIAQAIEITRALGEQFLWVDALCIVQDAEEKYTHLNAMASIFANAILTIVAADGAHADIGFRGLPGISEPRCAEQPIAPIHPLQQLVKPICKQVWDDMLLEPWSTRAWTFQEGILSRRLLYFSHDSVRWVCRKSRWSEESDSPDCMVSHGTTEQRQHSIESPQLSSSNLPCLHEYESLVNGFNCRNLSYPEDVLFAFAGVSSKLGRKFIYGLVSGLPAFFFDLCLLWQPLRRLGPAIRREPHRNAPDVVLPSWSWAGWVTEVAWPYTWNRTTDPAAPAAVILGSIRPFYQTKFYYTDAKGVEVQIPCGWAEHAIYGIDQQCPTGWYRHKVNFDENSEFGRLEDVPYFKHELDHSLAFWFPMPVSNSHWLPLLVDKVHFRGMVGKFKFGKVGRCMTQILTLNGTHAGTLWQHSEDDEQYMHAMKKGTPIDLVAIIGCVVSKDDHLWWEPPQTSLKALTGGDVVESEKTRQVYNVLWIVREGHVAYRKGSGEVDRSVWDKTVSRVEIDLTLC